MPAKIEIDTETLIKRYQDGESSTQLGIAFGISPNTVLNRLRAAGVKRRKSGTERLYDDAMICRMYTAGLSVSDIQEKTGAKNVATFYTILRRNGIPVRLQRHRFEDPEVEKAVVELRGKGLSYQAIAEKMRINRNYISKILRREVTLTRKVWQAEITVTPQMSINEMRATGATIDEIADIKGISRVEVFEIVGRNGRSDLS